jgi:CHASE3 domain sensor protein
MTKRSDSLLSWLLLVAIVVVGANAWFAFQAESTLADSESWVIHTWRAINMVERTLNAVEAMETGARGYLLSDDPTYLDSYHAGLRVLPTDIQRFKELTADNPRQQARAEELRSAVQARIDLLATQIALQNSGRREVAMAQIRNGVGRAQMQQLRQTVDAMQKEETAMLATRREDSAHAREEARATVLLASMLDLVLLISSLWLLARERRLRAEAAETAERLARLQQISDAALSQLSLETMHLEMLTRLRKVVQADAAAIYAYSPDGLQMTPPQAAGPHISIQAALGIDLSPGTVLPLRPDGPIHHAVESSAVVKLAGDGVLDLPNGEFSHSMRTLLILPLKVRGSVIGLILIGHLREDAFSASDEDLLVVAADRIAMAIDRAGLLEQETRARKSAEAAEAEVRLLNADLEARVKRRTEELETTNRELEAFSYSVSHDLRAPLRSVDGFSVALAEDYGALLQGEGQHYLTRIRVGVQRMGGLIDALLQLSRITRAELTTETVDLSALAADVAEDVQQACPGRSLSFSI